MSNLHGFRMHLMWQEMDIIQSVNNLFDIKPKNGILNLAIHKNQRVKTEHIKNKDYEKPLTLETLSIYLETMSNRLMNNPVARLRRA